MLRPTPDQKLTANAYWGHTRNCKKSLDECKVCRDSIEWFNQLPSPILSALLTERTHATS